MFRVVIFVLCLLAGIERFHAYQHGGFSLRKLVSDAPSVPAQVPDGALSLLDQPFHFLGKGGTCFVFLGEDGKTVLKLFKHQHLAFDTFLFRLAFPGAGDAFRLQSILAKQKKDQHKRRAFLFTSCQLAYDKLKEETGLLYLSLHPNPQLDRTVTLIDSWGIAYTFPLGKTEFALQKKAELFFPFLATLSPHAQREAIDALLDQIRSRCQKGIGDRDPNLLINYGFVDGKVVELDIGSFYPRPSLANPLAARTELFQATYQLQKWLEKHSPNLLDYVLKGIVSDEALE